MREGTQPCGAAVLVSKNPQRVLKWRVLIPRRAGPWTPPARRCFTTRTAPAQVHRPTPHIDTVAVVLWLLALLWLLVVVVVGGGGGGANGEGAVVWAYGGAGLARRCRCTAVSLPRKLAHGGLAHEKVKVRRRGDGSGVSLYWPN